MQIRWSHAAAEDFFRIIEYIRQENPPAAQRIAKTIYESAGSLKSFPHKGRTGRMEGTRELPLLPLPFIVVYRVLKDVVEIANVVHGAQRVATQGLEPTGWNCLRLDISEPAKNLLRDHPNLR